MNFGYYKLFSISPKLKIAKPLENLKEHIKAVDNVVKKSKQPSIILFPELSISAYTCEDLFLNEAVIQDSVKALEGLIEHSKSHESVVVVGAPIESMGSLYNTAVIIYKGKVLGVVPKSYLPNYGEFYEKRWFTSGIGVDQKVSFSCGDVLLSANQVFKVDDLTFGVEICEDLFAPISSSTNLALSGAQLILNLSASNDLIGKYQYRKDLVKMTSARLNCGYLYASAGLWESTRDLVFGGHMLYFENGTQIAESERFSLNTEVLETEVDVQKLNFERRRNKTFGDTKPLAKVETVLVSSNFSQTLDLTRVYDPYPFTPKDETKLKERVAEILEMQSSGLVRRLLSLPKGSQKMVLGLSGGSDSTLALLVAKNAIEKLVKYGYDFTMKDVHCLSMPGFGTSERTKNSARGLARETGCHFEEIDITKTTQSHLDDIKHDKIDVVYENAQARERTQILFDYANKVGGIVVNTGNLNENYLGWATFGADQLGNYGVNSTVPKSLVKYIIKHYPTENLSLRQVLNDVLGTTVSPELLPLDSNGNIQQSSEKSIGNFDIHEFTLFHFIRSGFSEDKIKFLAKISLKDKFSDEEIESTISSGLVRFRRNQFKRTCSPSGIKIGSVNLSIREARYPDETE